MTSCTRYGGPRRVLSQDEGDRGMCETTINLSYVATTKKPPECILSHILFPFGFLQTVEAPNVMRMDLIRGKGVQDAVNLLTVTNKVAARHVQKCLKSAIANAENREDHVDVDRLFVKEVFVDGGPMMKRVREYGEHGVLLRIDRRQ